MFAACPRIRAGCLGFVDATHTIGKEGSAMRTTLTTATLLGAALIGRLGASGALVRVAWAEETTEARKTPAGFPAPDQVQRLYDEADLNRAIQAYRARWAS